MSGSNTALFSANAPYLEALYARYLDDPEAVDPAWRTYFATLKGQTGALETDHRPVWGSLTARNNQATGPVDGPMAQRTAEAAQAVRELIASYRRLGHLNARVDPLGHSVEPRLAALDPATHGLAEDADGPTYPTGDFLNGGPLAVAPLVSRLRRIYTGSLGADFDHVRDPQARGWLQQRFEARLERPNRAPALQRRLLERLIAAEELERYLHHRYVGKKRFSLEGAEAFIPLIDQIIERAAQHGLQELIFGMAHRGRLNLLVNILGKSLTELALEFEGRDRTDGALGHAGDVRYHLGDSADRQTEAGLIHLGLAFNPSHLEIIDPVVQGTVRARQERIGRTDGDRVMAILIHGDAAVSGQGVMAETLNLAGARGFSTGGTFHVVINNQIGFTTGQRSDLRSTPYPSDIGRFIDAPIIHANADDPEAVLEATELLLDFRMRFHQDVMLDLVCYRRHGHNESDEPAMTHPALYQRIAEQPTVVDRYGEQLQRQAVCSAEERHQIRTDYQTGLTRGHVPVPGLVAGRVNPRAVDWAPYQTDSGGPGPDTGLPGANLEELGNRLTGCPAGFNPHPQLRKLMERRRAMVRGERPIDWGLAEALAYASLCAAGHPVRLTGQDTVRGTFAHRHAILHDPEDDTTYCPLHHLGPDQAPFCIYDSPLSEAAVLGFEYGYSTVDPNTLVVWEAQFGDFANGAQVVIDQFIASAEIKWGRACGLTLLLPHGYEGQGPEHSSARLERFLALCAQDNMEVVVPTTPAQIFHGLRRQILRPRRKPLVVLTPKSLLRLKAASSPLSALTQGSFERVIGEADPAIPPERVDRIILCTGKVYYTCLAERHRRARTDVALIRLEALYPFPADELESALAPFVAASIVVWCQEEPQNQGAWGYLRPLIHEILRDHQRLCYAGRPTAASPAVGYPERHVEQERALLADAFERPDPQQTPGSQLCR